MGGRRGVRRAETSDLHAARLIQRKFGVDAAEVRGRVEAADLDTLDLWADRILDAGTLDEVFGEQALAS